MTLLSLLLFANQTKPFDLFNLCTLSYFFWTNISPFLPLAFFRSIYCHFIPSFADFSLAVCEKATSSFFQTCYGFNKADSLNFTPDLSRVPCGKDHRGEDRWEAAPQWYLMTGEQKNKRISKGGMISQRVNLFRVACHPHLTHSKSCSSPFPGLLWPCSSCLVADILSSSAPEQKVVELELKT